MKDNFSIRDFKLKQEIVKKIRIRNVNQNKVVKHKITYSYSVKFALRSLNLQLTLKKVHVKLDHHTENYCRQTISYKTLHLLKQGGN